VENAVCFSFLERVLGLTVMTFCYPFVGKHALTADTVSLLEDAGALCSFDVNPRDITAVDLREGRQALPRYDCNMFPYGRASLGPARPEQAGI
jgi:hypothetical protein